jgi:3-hydroxyacyl-[acyl-carrier-protein] dehydratase
MKNTLLTTAQIWDFLPQKAPFQMVDALYNCEQNQVECGLTVQESNIFIENGFFAEPGILEHIAQTMALKMIYHAAEQVDNESSGESKMGYIAAIKNFSIQQLVPVGKELYTTVKVLMNTPQMQVVEAESRFDNQLVATCEMRLFSEN